MSRPDHGEEECPACDEVGEVPVDMGDNWKTKHEEYRQCKNDDCRVRLYTPYLEFFQ